MTKTRMRENIKQYQEESAKIHQCLYMNRLEKENKRYNDCGHAKQ